MNISKDEEEDFDRIKSIIDVLKPWLNYNLYNSEKESKDKPKSVSQSFEDELLQHGATLDEIKSLAKSDTIKVDMLEQELEREINGRG